MKILEMSKELAPKEKYYLTKSPEVRKMSEVAGETLDLDTWVIYESENGKGEEMTVFSARTVEGECYATNSRTFLEAFYDILECFPKEDIKKIAVEQRTSRNNRKFLVAVYKD